MKFARIVKGSSALSWRECQNRSGRPCQRPAIDPSGGGGAAALLWAPPPAPTHARRRGAGRGGSPLRAAAARRGVVQVGRVLDDLREADHGDGVLQRHLAAVDLLEEVDQLVRAAELGVVVLDLARGEVLDALDLDVVDDRVEELLARRVLVAHGDQDELVLAVLVPLVAQADRRRLAAPLHLVREDGRIEVEDLHRAAPYPFAARIDNARSIIARSPG